MVFVTNTNPKFPKAYYVGALPAFQKCLGDKSKKFAALVCSNYRVSPKVKISTSEIPTKALNLIADNCFHPKKITKATVTKPKCCNLDPANMYLFLSYC